MRIRVKYYVPFDQLMGKTEILEVKEELTIKALFTQLAVKYKGIKIDNIFKNVVVLINENVCKGGEVLKDGDQISILMPIVGG